MPANEWRRKWHEYHDQPQTRYQLSPVIRDSWERSERYKIDPFMKSNPYVCSKYELLQSIEKYQYLMDCSLPVMENIFHYITGSGQIMALLDSNATVLKVVGDYQSLEWARQANCIEGSIWAENLVGTNGANLALASVDPVGIFDCQHYCLFSTVASAVSAPLICENRKVGALVITGPSEKLHIQTLSAIVGIANQISSKLALAKALNYNDIFLRSVSEGIVILNNYGHITFINDKFASLFSLNKFATIGHSVAEMLSKEQDRNYLTDLLARETPGEETVSLFINNAKRKFHVSYNPINSYFPFHSERLILIQEVKEPPRMAAGIAENKKAADRIAAEVSLPGDCNNARTRFEDMIGADPKFLRIVSLARSVALTSANVLLLGESGTGKDIMAQAIHNASPRQDQPFLAINCAALPRELIASELFGYADGAFTGAKTGGHRGKFELADKGTILLDEIGDMPIDLQATLLRVLEDKTITRLGGTRPIPVDVRVIAATNKNLEVASGNNQFRSDLYYRLGGARIVLPPLRERLEDIPLLARDYINKLCRQLEVSPKELEPEIIEIFLQYQWPGNIRELQNVLASAVHLAAGPVITYESVGDYFQGKLATPRQDKAADFTSMSEAVVETEKQFILDTLAKNNYSKTRTANALGISRQTLYRRLKQYQLI